MHVFVRVYKCLLVRQMTGVCVSVQRLISVWRGHNVSAKFAQMIQTVIELFPSILNTMKLCRLSSVYHLLMCSKGDLHKKTLAVAETTQ